MLITEGTSITMATTAPPCKIGNASQHLIIKDRGYHLIFTPTEAGIPKSVKHRGRRPG